MRTANRISILFLLILTISNGTSLWNKKSSSLTNYHVPKINIGDVILVTITETTKAQQNNKTEITDESTTNNDILSKLHKVFRLSHVTEAANLVGRLVDNLSSTSHSSETKGDGKMTADASLDSFISVFVKKILPNGNLLVEGDKSILINAERHTIKLSGTVRPADITNNTIISTKIANAQIDFVGKGAFDGTKKPGAIQKLLNVLF